MFDHIVRKYVRNGTCCKYIGQGFPVHIKHKVDLWKIAAAIYVDEAFAVIVAAAHVYLDSFCELTRFDKEAPAEYTYGFVLDSIYIFVPE
jgi:hypothetical protein